MPPLSNDQRKEKTAWLLERWMALNRLPPGEKGLALQRRIEEEILKINEPFLKGNVKLPPNHLDRFDILNMFRLALLEALATFKTDGGASFLTWWAFRLQKALAEWREWIIKSNRLVGGRMEPGVVDGLMLKAGKRGWRGCGGGGGGGGVVEEAGDCLSLIDRFSAGGDGRTWRIMQWKFIEGLTASEIGTRLGLSRERVRQVIEKEVDKMRRGRRLCGY